MEKCKSIYFQLFFIFFKLGLFTVGGGYAMLPMLQKEVVEKKKWVSEAEIMDYYAIGQSTPGIIAINTATFIGYKKKGVIGGIVATLGMVAPSWIIIISIAAFFQQFADQIYVQKAFAGIRVAVVVLIINAITKMAAKAKKDYLWVILFGISFMVISFMNVSPVYIIILSAITGIILKAITERREGRK